MGAIMVGTSDSNLQDIPTPTAIKFGINDISSSDAGRTNDADVTMHKNRVARKRTISLTWNGLNGADTRKVLRAFRHQYFYVQYFEPEENAYVTKRFYSGDQNVEVGSYTPTYSYYIGDVIYKTISFNIIEV